MQVIITRGWDMQPSLRPHLMPLAVPSCSSHAAQGEGQGIWEATCLHSSSSSAQGPVRGHSWGRAHGREGAQLHPCTGKGTGRRETPGPALCTDWPISAAVIGALCAQGWANLHGFHDVSAGVAALSSYLRGRAFIFCLPAPAFVRKACPTAGMVDATRGNAEHQAQWEGLAR